MKAPVDLYRAANRAAADAMRLARQPEGTALAALRAQDARNLRKMARKVLEGRWC